MKHLTSLINQIKKNRILIPLIFVIVPGSSLNTYIEYLTTGVSLYFIGHVSNVALILFSAVLFKLSVINKKQLITTALYSIVGCILFVFIAGYFDPNFIFETNFLHYQVVIATVLFAAGTMVKLKHLLTINVLNMALIVFCALTVGSHYLVWRFVFVAILVSGGGFVAFAGQKFVRSLYRKIKEARAINERQNQELMKMNKAKDHLFRIIGHDLRTPFHQLNLLIDLMAEAKDKEQIEEYRDLIKDSASKGTELLEDLLNWSQNISEMDVKLAETSIARLVDKTFDFFKFNCGVKEISLINELPQNLKLKISDSMMETVFRNVIGNAIKFSHPNSKIVVNSILKESHIDISIVDQGVGISSDRLQKLLTDGRAKSTNGTNNERGTGYGLGIVKKLVERQKGSFSIASQLERGTTVTLSFPLVA